MAPSATAVQSLTSKIKRPAPPGIQTNGVNSSTSSPSPSMSASKPPSGPKVPPNSAVANGAGNNNSSARSANRARREVPGQHLGRGQRNTSVGLRSASLVGEIPVPQVSQPQPYIKTDEYILKRYRGNPPSLIVHLHPTHFRFDQQEGSFSYKSPMRLLIEHLRLRTVPHDLVEFFTQSEVPFYEGCMIVQIHDHKSSAPTQGSNRTNTGVGKTVPFSVHNYNAYLTPSSYVPYPTENTLSPKGKGLSDVDSDDVGKLKTSEQKDKENMPAPSLPIDGQRSKSGAQAKKPKVSTIILHPTPISTHVDIAIKSITPRTTNADGRLESRQDANGGGPLSASLQHPPTPVTAIPSTPLTSMAPPAKRLKKTKMELDCSNLYAAESQITLATSAPLILDPVGSVAESAALLESLAHPMHSEKPPSPKTRKRTVAEMAADEALAADQERYMLILDERLSSSTTGAQGGANPTDGDGQAGGASFEPRFERFKALENIKIQHAENKRAEKVRQQEAEKKQAQDRERERLRVEAEKREQQERSRTVAMQQQAQRQQQQEAHRRVMVAQAQQQPQQGLQGVPAQIQGQHAHPQPNGIITNGMQAQPQRFHQQQVSQAQISSPIVQNGTPHSHPSPIVNNMGNIPMQNSTSSMGGSPPRPGSVVQQNHQQMGAPTAHGMSAQRSQQSHSGTPRIPSATPNVQSTPLIRQISQTPRMSQASPMQGQMSQAPHMTQMMVNGQPMNLNPAQQQQLQMQQQVIQQRQRQNQQAAAQQAAQSMGGMNNSQQMSPQQFMQAQMMRAQQHQGNPMPTNNQIAQNYAAQMAAMAQRSGGMPPNMNQNLMSNNHAMQNLQQMQQAQQQQHPQMSNQQALQQQIFQQQVLKHSSVLYQQNLPALQAQYPIGIPDEVLRNLRMQCQQQAQIAVSTNFRMRRQMAQQQQMMAQGGMPQNMNGMQNGMPQRQTGM